MHLELMRVNEHRFPEISEPERYTSARIWHCRYRTLAPLGSFTNLQVLQIASFPDDSLDLISSLTLLEDFSIVHLPKVTNLSPLRTLTALARLELATLPSWDASGKVTEVASLAPLTRLPILEEVNLFGVRPPSKSVDDLLRCQALKRARISKYPSSEIERLDRLLDERRTGS